MTAKPDDDMPRLLVAALRRQFAQRWHIEVTGHQLRMHPKQAKRGVPRRQVPTTAALLATIETAFAQAGVPRAALLPLRWGRDTDLTISAIQALDPWLKDGANRVWREGFLPQPVVRFTGERDQAGRLHDGYLTAFVNLSCVQRTPDETRHVELVDAWFSALSAIGIHAGRLTVHGDLTVWRRGPVSGITLHCSCDGLGMSDAVLLWNRAKSDHMATDIGSGLERLAWLLSQRPWPETTFGEAATWCSVDVLDAVRTATLLTMNGIRPGTRGPSAALHRVLRRIPATTAAAGLSRLVRTSRAYWTQVGMVGAPWPHLTELIETAVLNSAQANRTSP